MTCELLEAIKAQKVMDCQYHKARRAGDEIGDFCNLREGICQLAYGGECEVGEAEWLKEEHEIKPKRPSYRIIKEE